MNSLNHHLIHTIFKFADPQEETKYRTICKRLYEYIKIHTSSRSDKLRDIGIAHKFYITPKIRTFLLGHGKTHITVIKEIPDKDLFHEAAKFGCLEIVKYLVERGIDVNTYDTTLMSTSEIGHFEVVKYLIESGADINSRGGGPLLVSIIRRHTEISEYLIDNGADMNLLNNLKDPYDWLYGGLVNNWRGSQIWKDLENRYQSVTSSGGST